MAANQVYKPNDEIETDSVLEKRQLLEVFWFLLSISQCFNIPLCETAPK